ncbi:hypothetical protein [Methanobrevibacter sp.]|uniref:hypothetical protein n=1 Tax=Methanobrevibacter sp. TaxID=66852 RepID=UPI003863FD12
MINMHVEYNGDTEELKEKIREYLNKANEELTDIKITSVDFEPTDNPYIQELKIPDEAYDENGDLKENYRKAYKTVIEDYREAHHGEIDDDAPKPMEIADATTMDLKYIINNLIENTGIINSVRLRFKKSQTATILKTLAQYETMLDNHFLTWSIRSYYDEDGLELNFTRE